MNKNIIYILLAVFGIGVLASAILFEEKGANGGKRTATKYDPYEQCKVFHESELLKDAKLLELEKAVAEYFETVFESNPEIAQAFKAMPEGWYQQQLLSTFGKCYLEGKYVKKDISRAVEYFKLAEKRGSKEASHILASLRLFQATDPKEKKKGFIAMEKEYKAGSAFAAGKLGHAYQMGFGVKPNLKKALELYEFAADKGMTNWQFLLAHAYEKGYLGLKQDSNKAQYWLNKQPKVHNVDYDCLIAQYYRDGAYPKNSELHRHHSEKCKKAVVTK
jgi:TPR repeat protein